MAEKKKNTQTPSEPDDSEFDKVSGGVADHEHEWKWVIQNKMWQGRCTKCGTTIYTRTNPLVK